MQQYLFAECERREVSPFRTQLLKWVGNKQRISHEIVSYFPLRIGAYIEPFLGGGGVLGTLNHVQAIGSDVFAPLIEIWRSLHDDPTQVKRWYTERWRRAMDGDKVQEYERIKADYNNSPNGADLLFLCRACYGGVVRFRQADGFMSTPCGVHNPISPDSFGRRVDLWHQRTSGTQFLELDFEESMALAKAGDVVYCDPPYICSQRILYGSQQFELARLFKAIAGCKARGAFVALSIDGTKRSGNEICNVPIPAGLFAREVAVNCGRSMLKRFQMSGRTLEQEVVSDRLLLTH